MRPMVPSRECDGSVSGDIFVHTIVSSVSLVSLTGVCLEPRCRSLARYNAVMAESPLEIHVIADSTGETAVRLARAARSQFEGVHWHIVRHPMIGTVAEMMAALEAVMAAHEAGQWVCVVHTLVLPDMRRMVADACEEMGIREVNLMGPMLAAMEEASGLDADAVPRRPVGVEADYFTRISAMEFAVRNDDGAIPDRLTEADICLVGVSRSGKTPLSIYLGYLGYKTVNVPLVPGIAPPPRVGCGGSLAHRWPDDRRPEVVGDSRSTCSRARWVRQRGRICRSRRHLRRAGRGGQDPASTGLPDHRHDGSGPRGVCHQGHRHCRSAGEDGWHSAAQAGGIVPDDSVKRRIAHCGTIRRLRSQCQSVSAVR